MKELHIYLYGEIAPDSFDPQSFGGPKIFGTNWLVSQLNSSPDSEEVIVHINSPGGDVAEGFALHDILASSGKKITTVVEGRAASIATVVALAGSVRKITQNSTFLIHNPWQDGWIGDADHFRGVADKLEAVEQIIANFYAEKTGQPVETLLAYMEQEKEFTADEAMAMGFFTEVIETVPAKAYVTNIETMSKPNLIERLNAAVKALKGVKNADFSTADGGTLQIETEGDEPAVGDSVSIDGQPAPDGEYKLADGKSIVVQDGKITEVKPAEPPATPDETTQALANTVQALAESVQAIQKTVSEIQAKQDENTKALNSVTDALEVIGTTTASNGFKKTLNKAKLNEDPDQRTKTAEEQKASAIAEVRKRKLGVSAE